MFSNNRNYLFPVTTNQEYFPFAPLFLLLLFPGSINNVARCPVSDVLLIITTW